MDSKKISSSSRTPKEEIDRCIEAAIMFPKYVTSEAVKQNIMKIADTRSDEEILDLLKIAKINIRDIITEKFRTFIDESLVPSYYEKSDEKLIKLRKETSAWKSYSRGTPIPVKSDSWAGLSAEASSPLAPNKAAITAPVYSMLKSPKSDGPSRSGKIPVRSLTKSPVRSPVRSSSKASSVVSDRGNPEGTVTCRYFMMGICKVPHKCAFLHKYDTEGFPIGDEAWEVSVSDGIKYAVCTRTDDVYYLDEKAGKWKKDTAY